MRRPQVDGVSFVLGFLLGGLFGIGLAGWLGRPQPLVVDVPTPPPPPTAAPLTVYVSGAVARPGVYTLPPGSRVRDAIEAAGGFTEEADPDHVNLAQPLADGEHIRVPTRKSEAQRGGQRTPTPTVAFPVDINTAPAAALEAIPGIGPAIAERIIANRPYGSVDDLLRVRGIGPATLEKIRPYVTVGPP